MWLKLKHRGKRLHECVESKGTKLIKRKNRVVQKCIFVRKRNPDVSG